MPESDELYVAQHAPQFEPAISRALAQAISERAEDPVARIAELLVAEGAATSTEAAAGPAPAAEVSAVAEVCTMPQLRSTDGQPVELSEQAAWLSATLQNALNDTAGNAPVPVPLGAASLARVAALLERTVAVVEGAPEERRAELRKQGLPRGATLDDKLSSAADSALAALGVASLLDAAVLLRELRWFDAALPTTLLAERAAQLLRGQPAAALRELLGVASKDHLSSVEMSAVLAEPLCAPAAAPAAPVAAPAAEAAAPAAAPAAGAAASAESPAPPPPARSVSLAMDDSDPFEGNVMACLERCDARTLRELKAVSAAWQRRAREVLCDAASAWRQQPIWSPSAEGRALAAQLGSGGAEERREVLLRMGEELDRGVDLPGHALAVVPLLEGSDVSVRSAAVQTLGELEVAALAQHPAALVAVRDATRKGRPTEKQVVGVLAAYGRMRLRDLIHPFKTRIRNKDDKDEFMKLCKLIVKLIKDNGESYVVLNDATQHKYGIESTLSQVSWAQKRLEDAKWWARQRELRETYLASVHALLADATMARCWRPREQSWQPPPQRAIVEAFQAALEQELEAATALDLTRLNEHCSAAEGLIAAFQDRRKKDHLEKLLSIEREEEERRAKGTRRAEARERLAEDRRMSKRQKPDSGPQSLKVSDRVG